MVMLPGTIVPQPQSLGRRYGLLTAAVGPMDMPAHGAGGGVQYEDESCGLAHPYPLNCEPEDRPEKTFDDGNPQVEGRPFAVLASMLCGALGFTEEQFRNKIEARLENGEQRAAEYALWHGETEGSPGVSLDIETIGDAPEVGDPYDPTHLASVIAALEQFAYGDQGYSGTAFVHAPVGVAAWGNHFGELVIKDGPLYRTPMGSIWVFGGGYPAGDGLRITGQVNVWRSAASFTFPPDQTMDRTTNQRRLLSEREYAIAFDCLVGAADFNPLEVS